MKKINWLLEIKKVILLMAGLTIAHLGVTFFIQADMGADPYNVLVQGVFRSVPWPEGLNWTHGMTHILICLLIVLVLLAVDRSYIGIGTYRIDGDTVTLNTDDGFYTYVFTFRNDVLIFDGENSDTIPTYGFTPVTDGTIFS